MSHQHDHHDHDHHHHDEAAGQTLSFEDKLVKIFEHWVRHNESHAETYVEWSRKAKAQGLEGIAALLDDISQISDRLTDKLKAGLNEARNR